MKQTVFSISEAIGINRVFAAITRNQPLILTFHGVTPDTSRPACNEEGLHLELPVFTRLMSHVARACRPVSLAEIVDWMDGRAALPERAVAVTFDDGYRNVLTSAAPVLASLEIPATVFVTTDFVHGGRMLWTDRIVAAVARTDRTGVTLASGNGTSSWSLADGPRRKVAARALVAALKQVAEEERLARADAIVAQLGVSEASLRGAWRGFDALEPSQLAQLPGYGVDVGAHTCSHPILTRVSPDALVRELVESKQLIERSTGKACDLFAYPNGGPDDFDARTREAVMAAGYRAAFTTIKQRVARQDDRYAIPRCTLTHNSITFAEFAAEVSGFPGVLRAARSRMRAPQAAKQRNP